MAPETTTVEGVLSRMIWQKAGTEFVIAELDADGGPITVKGALPGATVGGCYRIEGPIGDDDFGQHVKIRTSLPVMPKSKSAIRSYLRTLPGIGAVRADKLVRAYGDRALEEFKAKSLDDLNSEAGLRISEEKLRATRLVLDGMEGDAEVKLTVRTLLGDEGTDKLTKKVLEVWGKDTPNLIRENPWRLTEIPQVGFARADAVARHLGHAPDSPDRVDAAVSHAMGEIRSSGHTAALATSVVARTESVLEIGGDHRRYRELILDALDRLTDKGGLSRLSGDRLQLDADRWSEEEVARVIRGRVARASGWSEARLHDRYPSLAEDQLAALKKIVAAPTAILVGAPGTGKTYTVKELLRSYAMHRVKLCAPTGKAARRLAESTGYKAQTIHRLLEPMPRNERGKLTFGFSKDATDPLEADVVIVDEFSMVDGWLFEKLLAAIPPSCRLVLVGDPHQLPSVGAGAVLRDLITSGIVPVAELTEIKRTDPGLLLEHIHEVREGGWTRFENQKDGNLFVLKAGSFDEAAATMATLYLDRLPSQLPKGVDPIMGIQLIVPWRVRTKVSVAEINARIHELRVRRGDVQLVKPQFGIGEKVLQTRNDPEAGIVNGDIGRIVEIKDLPIPAGAPPEEQRVETCYLVDFEGYEEPVPLNAYANSLELAYAITIHKSQGSEWPIVVIPAMGTTSPFYDRSLFYTALSRAKSLGVLVGDQGQLWRVLERFSPGQRMTNLVEELLKGGRP